MVVLVRVCTARSRASALTRDDHAHAMRRRIACSVVLIIALAAAEDVGGGKPPSRPAVKPKPKAAPVLGGVSMATVAKGYAAVRPWVTNPAKLLQVPAGTKWFVGLFLASLFLLLQQFTSILFTLGASVWLNPPGFAKSLCTSIGLFHASFFALRGVPTQMKLLTTTERLPFTMLTAISMLAALYASLEGKRIGSLLFSSALLGSFLFDIMSHLPGGRHLFKLIIRPILMVQAKMFTWLFGLLGITFKTPKFVESWMAPPPPPPPPQERGWLDNLFGSGADDAPPRAEPLAVFVPHGEEYELPANVTVVGARAVGAAEGAALLGSLGALQPKPWDPKLWEADGGPAAAAWWWRPANDSAAAEGDGARVQPAAELRAEMIAGDPPEAEAAEGEEAPPPVVVAAAEVAAELSALAAEEAEEAEVEAAAEALAEAEAPDVDDVDEEAEAAEAAAEEGEEGEERLRLPSQRRAARAAAAAKAEAEGADGAAAADAEGGVLLLVLRRGGRPDGGGWALDVKSWGSSITRSVNGTGEAIQQSGAFFGRLWSQIGEGMDAPLPPAEAMPAAPPPKSAAGAGAVGAFDDGSFTLGEDEWEGTMSSIQNFGMMVSNGSVQVFESVQSLGGGLGQRTSRVVMGFGSGSAACSARRRRRRRGTRRGGSSIGSGGARRRRAPSSRRCGWRRRTSAPSCVRSSCWG